jgi:hypothetical protein
VLISDRSSFKCLFHDELSIWLIERWFFLDNHSRFHHIHHFDALKRGIVLIRVELLVLVLLLLWKLSTWLHTCESSRVPFEPVVVTAIIRLRGCVWDRLYIEPYYRAIVTAWREQGRSIILQVVLLRRSPNRLQLGWLKPNDVSSCRFTFWRDWVLLVGVVDFWVDLSETATQHFRRLFFINIKAIVNILVGVFLPSWNLNFLLLTQGAISVWTFKIIDCECSSPVDVALFPSFNFCVHLTDLLGRRFKVWLI